MYLDDYIIAHSDPEPDYLQKISRRTHLRMINPRMMSDYIQGRLLAMLTRMIKPQRVLELGTYSGYSALCIAEALPPEGIIHTVEHDDELEDFIRENFLMSPLSTKIILHTGDALDIIQHTGEIFDLVFIDADKREYSDYYRAVLPKVQNGGFILADNTLWGGKVTEKPQAGDRQTQALLKFNKMIAGDMRVEKIILPLRDGLTLIRKK
jgi:predicted O-methyltransferase YrrM